jgi:hypothetical protein
MADNSRIPGSPSDMNTSRDTRQHYSNTNPPPPPLQYPQGQSSPGPSSGNTQARNVIIGAIATIIASTTVYYLTQYVNNRKSESAPGYAEMKLGTINAWNRFVTIDNLYYKSVKTLGADKELVSNLDNFNTELFKLTDDYIKAVQSFIDEKNIDKNFLIMANRRIRKEKESLEKITTFYNSLKSIASSNLEDGEKYKKMFDVINKFQNYSRLDFELGALDLEELSKSLVTEYGFAFDPNAFLIYADYKKGLFNLVLTEEETHPDSSKATKNIDPVKLVGKWKDGESELELSKDGSMNYSLSTGIKGAGTWKIEDHKLRIDGTEEVTKQLSTQFYWLFDITKDSFVMKLNIPPYSEFNAVRLKNN